MVAVVVAAKARRDVIVRWMVMVMVMVKEKKGSRAKRLSLEGVTSISKSRSIWARVGRGFELARSKKVSAVSDRARNSRSKRADDRTSLRSPTVLCNCDFRDRTDLGRSPMVKTEARICFSHADEFRTPANIEASVRCHSGTFGSSLYRVQCSTTLATNSKQ